MYPHLTLGRFSCGKPVAVSRKECAPHFLLTGGSGSGKSTAIRRMHRQFVSAGAGVLLLCPHGSLVDEEIAWAASHGLDRNRRISLVEPRLSDFSASFNPLAIPRAVLAEGVSNVVDAMAQVWGGTDMHAFPRLARMVRNTCYLLAENGLTLAEAKTVLLPENKQLRRNLASKLSNPYYRAEWQGLDRIPEKDWQEFIESTENRLAPFLSSPVVNRMIGQTARTLDLGSAMENGECVYVNLRIGPNFTEQSQRLIGTLLLNEVRLRALQRKHNARPFYVFVDEAPKFLTSDIESMLVETRKFGVHLVLAHQNLGQLRAAGDAIYSGVMGIPNKLVFGRLSTEDARVMAEEMFCGELNMEKPKKRHTMPVTVGYRPVWLRSMGTTHSHAEFASQTDTESQGDGIAGPHDFEHLPSDDPQLRLSRSSAKARGTGFGSTDSESSNEGMTEGREPILEERPVQLYSLEELKEEAAGFLKNLAPGVALAKIEGRKPVHVAIPLPAPTLKVDGPRVTAWKRRLFESAPHIATAAQVDAEIAERASRLLTGVSAVPESDVLVTGRMRRVK